MFSGRKEARQMYENYIHIHLKYDIDLNYTSQKPGGIYYYYYQ